MSRAAVPQLIRRHQRAIPRLLDPSLRVATGWTLTPSNGGTQVPAFNSTVGFIQLGIGSPNGGSSARQRVQFEPGRTFQITYTVSRQGVTVAGTAVRCDVIRVSDGTTLWTNNTVLGTGPGLFRRSPTITADGPIDLLFTDTSPDGTQPSTDVTIANLFILTDPAEATIADPSMRTLTGWTVTGPANSVVARYFPLNYIAGIGFGVSDLAGGSSIRQDVSTVAGNRYQIHWGAARNGVYGTTGMSSALRLVATSVATGTVLYDDTIQCGFVTREQHGSPTFTADGPTRLTVTDVSTATTSIDVVLNRLDIIRIA